MKNRYAPNRANPKTMITHFREIFKSIGLKKPSFRNLLLAIIAVCRAKTFRINEIATRLPIAVKTEKSRQKRLLRFLDTPLPLTRLQNAWFTFIVGHLLRIKADRYFLLLVDETDLIDGWKAIVAAMPFRHRAIPVFWFIYKDEEIQSRKYKSHNEIIQRFCLKLYQLSITSQATVGKAPILVFDRGFARGKYVIKFLKDREIPFIMRICRNVGIRYQGAATKLDDLKNKFYGDVLYHTTHQIPLQLYVRRNNGFKDPMYLISNHVSGHQLYHCYKRRMQIEHGFRDIKSCFGFGKLVLKKPTHPRVAVLWLLACVAYGLLFLSYEKSATRWAKTFNGRQKRYSVINVIKRVISDAWHSGYLLSFFTDPRCRGDTLFGIY